ncbi:MAG TPA: bestrophin family ion channel, partial [Nannocystaceae bacterium]|nr:bestrophin family ion channel [Nannocystaceae bacterium]
MLGRALDAARDLGRQLTTLIPDHEGWPERRADMLRWTRAFYALVAQSVRGETDLAKLGEKLTTEERERLGRITERAPVVATWISAHLGKLQELKQIDSSKLRAIDSNLTSLIQALGGCQRIRHTPV